MKVSIFHVPKSHDRSVPALSIPIMFCNCSVYAEERMKKLYVEENEIEEEEESLFKTLKLLTRLLPSPPFHQASPIYMLVTFNSHKKHSLVSFFQPAQDWDGD